MDVVNWSLILLIITVLMLLIYVVRLKILLGNRSGEHQKRIKELENQLADANNNLEAQQIKINDHFMKTSELFGQMTESYKAVFMHLAEGSEDLCTNDAALLKPSGSEFLTLSHEAEKASKENYVPEPEVEASTDSSNPIERPENDNTEADNNTDEDESEGNMEHGSTQTLTRDAASEKSDPTEDTSQTHDNPSQEGKEIPEQKEERKDS